MSVKLLRLSTSDQAFEAKLAELLAPSGSQADSLDVDGLVANILTNVKQDGDAAVLKYTQQFDQLSCESVAELEINADQLLQAFDTLEPQQRDALLLAKERIELYHSHQKLPSWSFIDESGHKLGQQVSPLASAGLYVPGGKASYPSSVIMNAIPAKVAGVSELVMMVPAPEGELNPLVLAAAYIAGVDRVFRIGGAQAIAAMAYGTETVPRVDKIVGPGNQYVASAKRQVFGAVGIDMIAGPSEILIYCDAQSDPDWIAMDLFSQAEHDELAQSILLCETPEIFDHIEQSIHKLLPDMPRQAIIQKSLENRGAFIHAKNRGDAIKVINRIAPEHLELSFDDDEAESIVARITSAGAIFIGRSTAEAFGDYCAGSNHVLPTSGSARFSSPLSVYDFTKRTSLIQLNKNTIDQLVDTASTLAHAEGLQAHAKSAEYRRDNKK